MPKFKGYKDFTRSLAVTLTNEETLTVEYRPASYNKVLNNRLSQSAQEGDNPDAPKMTDAAFIVALVSKWDWLDDKDKPLPITEEFLEREINVHDQGAIVTALIADLFPNSRTATTDSSPGP